MHALALQLWSRPGLFIVFGAAGLYSISRLAAAALAGGDPDKTGRRAVGHWIPIFAAVLAAVVMGRGELTVGIIFSTSVACLTLVLGLTAFLSPLAADSPGRRIWQFVLPAALLLLVIGFRGAFYWWHVPMLAVLGIVLYRVWKDPAHTAAGSVTSSSRYAGVLVPLLIVGALAAGAAAVYGIVQAVQTSNEFSVPLLWTFILSPILALPMLANTTNFSHRGHGSAMASTLVGVALLNLCVSLPAAILVWHVRPVVTNAAEPSKVIVSTMPATQATNPSQLPGIWLRLPEFKPLPYPAVTWRVDTVFLVVMGLFLLPAGLGRWNIGIWEGFALIGAYVVYLGASVFAHL